MKTGLRLGAIVLIGTFASGCAAGGSDARTLEKRLVAVGVAPAAAKCVVDAMNAKFGENRLGARAEPSAAELAAQRRLVRNCEVKVRK